MQQRDALNKRHDGPWKKEPVRRSTSGLIGEAAKRREARQLKELAKQQSIAGLKRRLSFDGDVPRCETCMHYRKAGSILIDSLPRFVSAACKLHSFNVRPVACCDTWTDKDGNDLAA